MLLFLAECTLLVDVDQTVKKLHCGPKYKCPKGQFCSEKGWCLYLPDKEEAESLDADGVDIEEPAEDGGGVDLDGKWEPDAGFEADPDDRESESLPDLEELECPKGHANCDNNISNGCEADLDNDPKNCGKCGHECLYQANVVTKCVSGRCRYNCVNDYTDINRDIGEEQGNGCECLHPSNRGNGLTCCDGPSGLEVCYLADGKGGGIIEMSGGTFWMGCRDDLNNDLDCMTRELPQHQVELSPFWIMRDEATQRDFARFAADTGGNEPNACGSFVWDPGARPNHPVACVTWQQAREFCTWLGGDLPTEAQWEYAARGPMRNKDDYRVYPFGDADPSCDIANYFGCNGSASAVGSLNDVSPFGVREMSGNVREWCRDLYGKDYYSNSDPKDPSGPAGGTSKVVRGGSWQFDSTDMRTASRKWADSFSQDLGFRCVFTGF